MFESYKPRKKSLAAKVRKLKTLLAKKKKREEKKRQKDALRKEYESLKRQLKMFK